MSGFTGVISPKAPASARSALQKKEGILTWRTRRILAGAGKIMERLENLAARLIAMAVSLVGDAGPVRKAMACSEYDFEAYCAGGKAEPTRV